MIFHYPRVGLIASRALLRGLGNGKGHVRVLMRVLADNTASRMQPVVATPGIEPKRAVFGKLFGHGTKHLT